MPEYRTHAEAALVHYVTHAQSGNQETMQSVLEKTRKRVPVPQLTYGVYKWTDAVPKDNPEFQVLLEEEEPAAYPDVLAELPGVEL